MCRVSSQSLGPHQVGMLHCAIRLKYLYTIPFLLRVLSQANDYPQILKSAFPVLSLDDQVHGTSSGGDADELRLLSINGTYINLRGYGGNLDFVSTKVRLVSTYQCHWFHVYS